MGWVTDRRMRIANMIGAVLRHELNRNRHGVAKLYVLFRPNGGLEREKVAPRFLSGKIDVFQLVRPTVAITRIEPHVLLQCAARQAISLDCLPDSVMKCHAPGPS